MLVNGIKDANMSIVSLKQVYPDYIHKPEAKEIQTRTVSASQCLRDSLNGIGGFVWNKLYKNDIITDNSLCFDERITMCEDVLFLSQYCSAIKTGNVNISNACLYYYVVRSGAYFGNFNPKELSVFTAIDQLDEIARQEMPDLVNSVTLTRCAFCQREIYKMHKSTGNYKAAEKRLQKILRKNIKLILKGGITFGKYKQFSCLLMALNIGIACFIRDKLNK